MDDEQELRILEGLMARMMAQMTGPMSDMTRSLMAAQVDGLIDARRKFLAAGWEEWMVGEAMALLVNTPRDTMRQIAGGMKGKS